jgi:hypothetical protein
LEGYIAENKKTAVRTLWKISKFDKRAKILAEQLEAELEGEN